MLTAGVALLFYLFPSQVNGLISTDAKCLSGTEWMFSSVGQSPCDVAAELRTACIGRPINIDPLPVDYHYVGPTKAGEDDCRCSSVVYALMSGCGYCQNRYYIQWSTYAFNCSKVYVSTFPRDIPIGVRVPKYAYQDFSTADLFNVTLAQSMVGGVESSRAPSASTASFSSASTSSTNTPGGANISGNANAVNNTPAIVGGVVGGLLGLAVIAAVITYLMLRSKKKPETSQTYNSGFQQTPSMAPVSPNTTASLIPPTLSPPPDSPGRVDSVNHHSIYSADASMYSDPYGQHPLTPNIMTPNHPNNNPQIITPNPNTGGGRVNYSGFPEL